MLMKYWPRSALLVLALAVGPATICAAAPQFESTTQLVGQRLQLNGQGVRYRAIIPVYEMALYTPKKASTPEELFAMPGPKRISFVALREVSGDQLGISLVRAMRDNADPAHRGRVAGFMDKLGRIFSTEKRVGAGQDFRLDYVPGKGTMFFIGSAQKGETVADPSFFEAILRIWVGSKPVDIQLKDMLLGAPPKPSENLHQG